MSGFGVKILCYDPYVNENVPKEYGVTPVELDILLQNSDYISVHCPLNDQTRHMLSRKQFDKMKSGAIVINTARGGIIDETALIEALQRGRIAAAGLDVTEKEPIPQDSPLLYMDNVIITPHNAWYSEESIATLQRMVGEEVVRVLSGQLPKNLVNKEVLNK